MRITVKKLLSILLLSIFTTAGYTADFENGKSLHDGNCINCHAKLVGGDGTAIYTREDRKIESYAALNKQVRRCRDSLGMPWPEDQIIDVITYLNKSFYHFEEE
ncbi:MAG: cytochrome c [Gammaproteobacteria bacterium]|jgi:hypothetical protein